MERKLESITLTFLHNVFNKFEEIIYMPCVEVKYMNYIDNKPHNTDIVKITKDHDYSNYEEEVQLICKIAFKNL